MGVVYKALDPKLDKTVAIKLIRADCGSPQQHMRFQQEAKALKDLKHQNIPEIYDFAITRDGEPFMIIDYIKGKSLKKHIEENQQLTLVEAANIIVPICETLKHAHNHSIFHRDVKPDNVIISFDEHQNLDVKIIDFGLARLENDLSRTQEVTKTGSILGSPKYMSPEQAKGKPANHSSDIYSTGCILFELLTGRPPYLGKTSLETIALHVTEEIESSFQYIPEDLKEPRLLTIFTKCLAKEPEDRYQNIEELSTALSNYIEEKYEVKPLIDVPELENSNLPTLKQLVKPAIILIAVGVLAFTLYENVGPILDRSREFLHQEATSNNNAKRNQVRNTRDIVKSNKPESDKPITNRYGSSVADDYANNRNITNTENTKGDSSDYFSMLDPHKKDKILVVSTFVHVPKKQAGYWTGAEDTVDNDFSGLNAFLSKRKNVPALNIVSNKSYTITGSGILYLRNLPVGRLDLESRALTDEALINASKIKGLYDLTVRESKNFTVKGFRALKDMPELRILNIENCQLPPGAINELAQLKSLYSLSLEGSKPVGDSDVTALTKMKNLGSITLDYTNVTPKGLRVLKKFKSLRGLKCEGLDVTDSDAEFLAKLPIECLDTTYNHLTAKGINALTKSKTLMRFDCNNQKWMNDKSLPEEVMEKKLSAYDAAAQKFTSSRPGRLIRIELIGKDPCK